MPTLRMINKKMLLITYHFPPDAAIGAVRQKEHAALLASLGWEVHVVTVKPKYYEKVTSGTELRHENISVHRTIYCNSPLKSILKLKNRFLKTVMRQEGPKKDSDSKKDTRTGVFRKVKRILIDINSFPDEQMMFIFPAVARALYVIYKHKINLVYVSSPPYTLNLIGLIVKIITNAKMIIEHRDPWTTVDFLDKPFDRTATALKFEHKLELSVLAHADAVVTTTSIYRDFLENQIGIPHDRLICVYNGYDSNKFAAAQTDISRSNDGPISFRHFGNFYFGRNPSAFLRAISELIFEGALQSDEVSVDLVGLSASDLVGDLCVGDLVNELNLASIVKLTPWVEREEALRLMHETDVLLLFQPDSWKMQIPAKTFEYLPLRKPILGLVGDGATADIIRECDAGLVLDQNDVPAIKLAIMQFVHSPTNGFYRNDRVTAYSRSSQVVGLDRFLTSLLYA